MRLGHVHLVTRAELDAMVQAAAAHLAVQRFNGRQDLFVDLIRAVEEYAAARDACLAAAGPSTTAEARQAKAACFGRLAAAEAALTALAARCRRRPSAEGDPR